MYYEGYDDINSDYSTTLYFHNQKQVFHVSSCMLHNTLNIIGDGFSFESECYNRNRSKTPPGQLHKRFLGKGCGDGALYYLGGSLYLLEYGEKKIRTMRIGDAEMAFSENGSMIFCKKNRQPLNGIPYYAKREIQCMPGYCCEMMVNDDLPLPLQALLAAL